MIDKERVLSKLDSYLENLKEVKKNNKPYEILCDERGRTLGFVECLKCLEVISNKEYMQFCKAIEEISFGDIDRKVEEILEDKSWKE